MPTNSCNIKSSLKYETTIVDNYNMAVMFSKLIR